MIVNGSQCPECKDIIYSRYGHDFRYCTCNKVFVDGGQEPGNRVGFTSKSPKGIRIEVVGVSNLKELVRGSGLIKEGVVDLMHKILPDDDQDLPSETEG